MWRIMSNLKLINRRFTGYRDKYGELIYEEDMLTDHSYPQSTGGSMHSRKIKPLKCYLKIEDVMTVDFYCKIYYIDDNDSFWLTRNNRDNFGWLSNIEKINE